MGKENKIDEMQGRFNSIKESDDFAQLPFNEKVNVILLLSLKKLEILDDQVMQFMDEDDKDNNKMLDKLFGLIRDDLIEIAVVVQEDTN